MAAKTKPGKSPPKFPLWLHTGTGQWAKKIGGRMCYFGTDPDAALERYVAERDVRGRY